MKIAKLSYKLSLSIASIAFAATTGGCGGQNPFLSYGPQPRVEDCAQIQQATPTKYICNGKQYTSVQLADIRLGKPSISGK
jgi:hypothetical protein